MTSERTGSTHPFQFIKLGGSLITDKHRPHTPRMEAIERLAKEIASVFLPNPNQRLIIGNGAGSYGHVPAKKFGTRQGVHSREEWLGFTEVWREAATLNKLVTDALHSANLPVIAIHPSSAVIASDGLVAAWDLKVIHAALDAGIVPVIHGDVIFDSIRGGTILSTEDLFMHLASYLHPHRILLAGIEAGVWADFPICSQLVHEIRPDNINQLLPKLGESNATDVTGGMASKVLQSLALIEEIPGMEVLIFSGDLPGAVSEALCGAHVGTILRR